MSKKKKFTVEEFYDYITSIMTPEEALKKLLLSSLMSYEKLKFDSKKDSVHPVIIMANAAMDMGWSIMIDRDTKDKDGKDKEVDGMALGTREYMERTFKDKSKDKK